MRWLRFSSLLLSTALAVSCARPSVEDDVLGADADREGGSVSAGDDDDADGSATERNSGSEPSATTRADAGKQTSSADAGHPLEVDAGCRDRDGDKICDPEDNCPGTVNPEQGDTDGDGIGDACEIQTSCNGEALPEMVDLGLARVRTVRLNGNDGTASVKPGARVQFSALLTFSSCGVVGGYRGVSVGVESGRFECADGIYCQTFVPAERAVALDFVAPSEPGLHYVGMSINQAVGDCGRGEGPLDVRVAAICVEP